ncbi:hypothetical protein HDU82_008154 [Entophlyctis luteolus]|nr:hypothetical protein HDU82_008154 [Entophlyctis luteolus]
MEVTLEAFEAKDPSVAFTCTFIEKQLAPAFRSANNPQSQAHLAFTIQELLQFCNFTAEFQEIGPSSSNKTTALGSSETILRLIALWQSFSRPTLEVIRPLLVTKYSMESKAARHLSLPVYSNVNGFKEWLQFWVVDLMCKVTGKYAGRIFSVCTKVVENESINIALYLLPRLVLNILTGESSVHPKEILEEFTIVLKDAAVSVQSKNIEKRQLSCQTIFQLIDHLTIFIRSRRRDAGRQRLAMARKSGRFVNQDELDDDKDAPRQRVAAFVSGIPTILLAEASFRCKSYARALLHFEQHIRHERKTKSETEMQSEYSFLQTIYSHLEEPDGMEGISTLFLNPTLEQQILEHESAGRWTAAQTCYEVSVQTNPDDFKLHTGLISCLKNLGHLGTMLSHINGIAGSHPHWASELNSSTIEASWRLGSWDALDFALGKKYLPTFDTDIGRLLLFAKQKRWGDFRQTLKEAHERLLAPLVAASMESYSRTYDTVVKLSMLHEAETVCQQFWNSNDEKVDILSEESLKAWELRLKITLPSLKVREPILNLRRNLVHNLSDDESSMRSKIESGRIWLQTAKLLRSAGHFQPAFSAILHAAELQAPSATLQKAKWLLATNQHYKAISELKLVLARMDPKDGSSTVTHLAKDMSDMINLEYNAKADVSKASELKAKTLLMLAKAMDETSMGTSEAVATMFEAVTATQSRWEKGYFFLGRYYNKLLENSARSVVEVPQFFVHICLNYAYALTYGTRYIYQTLPRLLTLWLDAGSMLSRKPEPVDSKASVAFNKVNKLMKKLIDKIPAYQFLPAVPQLVSRIGHTNKSVHQILELLLSTVLVSYPHQTLWNLLSVSKSKHKLRSSRCEAIMKKVQAGAFKQANPETSNIINEGTALCDQLLVLCNYNIQGKVTMLNMSRDFRNLKRLAPLKMIIPIQKTLTVTLPADGSASNAAHRPFPFDPPTIEGFYDDIEVMNSLQKPRKITILGSDSKDYIFLLKPKDDLRKDARLMEFNGLINKLLKKDSESRRRNLYIRTYAVVPLNEECGIIEWVENTCGFRGIVGKSYRSKGIQVTPQEIRDILESKKAKPEELFTKMVLPNLGDRHGENILFDELTGDCVHVDLNCLFEKGTTFEKPEMVPFRMTHNMVDAFGVTGTEGVFRKSCETSLRVLRTNRESLLAVLETFIHDPLCEWDKRSAPQARGSNAKSFGLLKDLAAEVDNEEAVKHLSKIEVKLKGMAKQGLPLSIEGQVQELIAEATDPKNLSVMYVGWAPFL